MTTVLIVLAESYRRSIGGGCWASAAAWCWVPALVYLLHYDQHLAQGNFTVDFVAADRAGAR